MDDLEARLGVRFRDGELLGRALVHSSAAQKHGGQKSNEQLEFLGDAVLQFIVTEALFLGYPDAPEGTDDAGSRQRGFGQASGPKGGQPGRG